MLVLLSLSIAPAMAKPVNVSAARNFAGAFYSRHSSTIINSIQLAYAETDRKGDSLYFAFNINSKDGFVIVSADDAAGEPYNFSEGQGALIGIKPMYTLDAGIQAIVVPIYKACGETVNPVVVLTNFGKSPLTSCQVNYKLDGGSVVVFNWTGAIASQRSLTVKLADSPATAGQHILTCYTSMPNGGADGYFYNDSTALTFTVDSLGVQAVANSTSVTSTLCPAGSKTFIAGGGSTYFWFNSAENIVSETDTLVADSAGTYRVNVMNASGCSAWDSLVLASGLFASITIHSDSAMLEVQGGQNLTAIFGHLVMPLQIPSPALAAGCIQL